MHNQYRRPATSPTIQFGALPQVLGKRGTKSVGVSKARPNSTNAPADQQQRQRQRQRQRVHNKQHQQLQQQGSTNRRPWLEALAEKASSGHPSQELRPMSRDSHVVRRGAVSVEPDALSPYSIPPTRVRLAESPDNSNSNLPMQVRSSSTHHRVDSGGIGFVSSKNTRNTVRQSNSTFRQSVSAPQLKRPTSSSTNFRPGSAHSQVQGLNMGLAADRPLSRGSTFGGGSLLTHSSPTSTKLVAIPKIGAACHVHGNLAATMGMGSSELGLRSSSSNAGFPGVGTGFGMDSRISSMGSTGRRGSGSGSGSGSGRGGGLGSASHSLSTTARQFHSQHSVSSIQQQQQRPDSALSNSNTSLTPSLTAAAAPTLTSALGTSHPASHPASHPYPYTSQHPGTHALQTRVLAASQRANAEASQQLWQQQLHIAQLRRPLSAAIARENKGRSGGPGNKTGMGAGSGLPFAPLHSLQPHAPMEMQARYGVGTCTIGTV